MSARRADFEECPRCGAYLLRELVGFHKCKGSQTWLRPANVPVEQWNAAVRLAVEMPPVPPPVVPAAEAAEAVRAETVRAETVRSVLVGFVLLAVVLVVYVHVVRPWLFDEPPSQSPQGGESER